MASQVSVGEENALRIRIYGTEKALEWAQESPETLIMRSNSGDQQILRRNWAGRGGAGSRLPAGHPEGFFEAFANIYTDMARAIACRLDNVAYQTEFPTVEDGVRGIGFIQAVLASAKSDCKWYAFKED